MIENSSAVQIDFESYKDIQFDSRKVSDGSIFFAIKGVSANGEEYITDALSKGAKLIVIDESSSIKESDFEVEVVKVHNIRKFLSCAAASKYLKHSPKFLTAVTGTNGKTSIAYFYKQLFNLIDKKCCIIGTTGVFSDAENLDFLKDLPDATTLDPVSFAKILSENGKEGIDYVCVEASSHGLSQYRLDVAKFCGMAFTNLTLDHMEYHVNMENYFDAKLRLFKDLGADNAFAVVNYENKKYFEKIKKVADVNGQHIIAFGPQKSIGQGANNNLAEAYCTISYSIEGNFSEVTINYSESVSGIWDSVTFKPQILGEFQISNLCAAIGLVLSSGIKFDKIKGKLDSIQSPVGRMQLVGKYNDGKIFVDYAHTPDALLKAIEALREIPHERMIVLFGCGGDRSHEKRKLMGEVANKFTDYVVVTDDNPRSENPKDIRREVLSSIDPEKVVEIADRGKAIRYATKALEPKDILLIAGKGHEKYQYIGFKKIEFSDIECVKNFLADEGYSEY